jgi:tripartite-type tricarboxylate transporter receptor subunit TctC
MKSFFFSTCALSCVLALPATASLAQGYPAKPIKWVVPSAPGDGSDSVGRLFADRMSRSLGQPIVIDNKPGAGGVLGAESVAKSVADGYTMIVGNAGSNAINAAIYTRLSYDVVKDFAPVALICTAPNVMVAGPGLKVKTVAEFVAYAKANPGKINYASGGIGSSSHLSGELFKSLTGVDMTHVPYKGAGRAVTAVLSDEVSVMIGNLPPWSAHIKSGKVHALAVTTPQRHAALADVPTLAETLPGFETLAWFGVLAPAATPKSIVDRVNGEINAVLAQPDVRERLATLGCDPAGGTPAAFALRINTEVARWKKLASEKNIRAD